tara:strand:+ start:474 stop:1007 length:534 start_codon:yes stop_codon:yes gene_type:complete
MKDIKLIHSKYINNNINNNYLITVDINNQILTLFENFKIIKKYKISTSKFGEGQETGSNKTPLGAHYIRDCIGNNAEIFTVFQNRIETNNLAEVIKDKRSCNEDIICSRILWLSGLENGINKGGNIDSYSRYIYIHGTNEEGLLGKKASHGCIRMSNSDIIELCNKEIFKSIVYITK